MAERRPSFFLMPALRLHSVDIEVQALGDLALSKALADQTEDIHFPVAQVSYIGFLGGLGRRFVVPADLFGKINGNYRRVTAAQLASRGISQPSNIHDACFHPVQPGGEFRCKLSRASKWRRAPLGRPIKNPPKRVFLPSTKSVQSGSRRHLPGFTLRLLRGAHSLLLSSLFFSAVCEQLGVLGHVYLLGFLFSMWFAVLAAPGLLEQTHDMLRGGFDAATGCLSSFPILNS